MNTLPMIDTGDNNPIPEIIYKQDLLRRLQAGSMHTLLTIYSGTTPTRLVGVNEV